MGYLPFYLLATVAAYALQYPWLLGAGLVVFLLRPWIPDPYLFFKHLRRVRLLKAEIAQNPENLVARRDLAKVWLEKRRPRRAIPLLESARRRAPEDGELALLYGRALLESGRAEEALEPLVAAAATNEKMMYGEAYLVAGRALDQLRRFAEAEDALGRYVRVNSSSVEGFVRLALVRREQGDKAGARAALGEALHTFAHAPRFHRRRELRWWARARLMSLGF